MGLLEGLGTTNPRQGSPIGAAVEHYDNPEAPVLLANGPMRGLPEGTVSALAMAAVPDPEANAVGRLRYDAEMDRARVVWPVDSAARVAYRRAAAETWRRLAGAGQTGEQPRLRFVSDASTSHPLGGVALGRACDLDGQVVGYRGLYVVDGALVPGSAAGAAPSLLISALAERVLDRFVETPAAP